MVFRWRSLESHTIGPNFWSRDNKSFIINSRPDYSGGNPQTHEQNTQSWPLSPAAVQEERQRNKEREGEVESTSAVNEEMPVEKILEAEMAVEQKTELHADGSSGGSSVSSPGGSCSLSLRLHFMKSRHAGGIPVYQINLPPSAQRPCHKHLSGSRQAALHTGGVGQEDPSLLWARPGWPSHPATCW